MGNLCICGVFSALAVAFAVRIADLTLDTGYPYPIRILAFFNDTAIHHFDTDFS